MAFREVDWELVDLFETGQFEFPVWEHGVARQIVRALLKKRVYYTDIADATGTDPSDFEAWLNQSGKVMVGEWVIHWINDKEDNIKRMHRKGTRGRHSRRRKQNHNRIKTQNGATKRTQSIPQTENNAQTSQNNDNTESTEYDKDNNNAIKNQDLFDPTKPYMSLPNQRLVPSAPELPENCRYDRTQPSVRPANQSSRRQRNLLHDIEQELKARQQGQIVPSAPVINRNDYELIPPSAHQRNDPGTSDTAESKIQPISSDVKTQPINSDVTQSEKTAGDKKASSAESRRQKFRKSKTSSKDLSTSERSGTESPKPDKTSRFLGWKIRLGKKRSSAPSIIDISSASNSSSRQPASTPTSPRIVPSAPILTDYTSDILLSSIEIKSSNRGKRKPIKPMGPPPTPPRVNRSFPPLSPPQPATDDRHLPSSTQPHNQSSPSSAGDRKATYNSIKHGMVNPGYQNSEKQAESKTSCDHDDHTCDFDGREADSGRDAPIISSHCHDDVKLPFPAKMSPSMKFKHKHCKCGKTRRPPPPLPPGGATRDTSCDDQSDPSTQNKNDKSSGRDSTANNLTSENTKPGVVDLNQTQTMGVNVNVKGIINTFRSVKPATSIQNPGIAMRDDEQLVTMSDHATGLALHAFNTRHCGQLDPGTLNRVVEKSKNHRIIMHDAIIHNYVNNPHDRHENEADGQNVVAVEKPQPESTPSVHDLDKNIPNTAVYENDDTLWLCEEMDNKMPNYVNQKRPNPNASIHLNENKESNHNNECQQSTRNNECQQLTHNIDASTKHFIPESKLQLPRRVNDGNIGQSDQKNAVPGKVSASRKDNFHTDCDYYNANETLAGEYVDLIDEPEETGGPGFLFLLTDKRYQANPTPTSYRFKIGSSKNPQQVLDACKQRSQDIDMIWKVKVRSHMTAAYHVREKLRQHRTGGDWFTCPLPVLMEEVAKVAKQYKLQ